MHKVACETGLPLFTSELGASAGLNLLNDQFCLTLGDQIYGDPDSAIILRPESIGTPPAPAALTIQDRAGVDLRPFDLATNGESDRLLSYLWPRPARTNNKYQSGHKTCHHHASAC